MNDGKKHTYRKEEIKINLKSSISRSSQLGQSFSYHLFKLIFFRFLSKVDVNYQRNTVKLKH